MEQNEEKPKRAYKKGRVARRPMKKKGERTKKAPETKVIVEKPNKYKVYSRENKARKREAHRVILRPTEREFKELKYLGFITNYICYKYDIDKNDFSLGLFLYEGRPFTFKIFNQNSIIILGKRKGEFNRFLKLGYIRPVLAKKYAPKTPEAKYVQTDHYRISLQFQTIITEYYELILKFAEADKGLGHNDFNSDEVMGLIYRYQREMKNIEKGILERKLITPIAEDDSED